MPPRRVRKLGPKQGRKPEYVPARREGEGGRARWERGRRQESGELLAFYF